jgi:hypothetical protein
MSAQKDYWSECIAQAADECDLNLTIEQLECLASAAESGHEHYGMAFYSPPDSDRISDIEREWKAKLKTLEQDHEKYVRNFGLGASWNPVVRFDLEWRIKPATITYTVTVPVPLRVMPEPQTVYWHCDLFVQSELWTGHDTDLKRFRLGRLWDTEAKAQAAFDALFGPLRNSK